MSHANAALTPRARLRLAKLIVEEHWPVATAAKMFMVSPPIAPQVGVGEETLRMWCNRHGHEITQAPAGEDLQQENKRLKRELAEAKRANEILKAASAFFAAELDRPTTR